MTTELKALTFGEALAHIKAGERVYREGWNGKGMWLRLIAFTEVDTASGLTMAPCIGMRTAQGHMQPGWLASQADMLAEDWHVLDD